MSPPPRWTFDELTAAVRGSTNIREVCRKLGIEPSGRAYRSVRAAIERTGVQADHVRNLQGGRRRYTDDELVEAVRVSRSVSEVLRRLGYHVSGGMHRFMTAHIKSLDLDTRHFTGRAWNKGQRGPSTRAVPLEELLVERSRYPSSKLRRRLIAAGLKPDHCELCGIDRWRGEVLPLHFDHVNGDHTDHRLENLRILCPNCHSLTDTWCRKKDAGVAQRQRHHV